MKMEELSDEDCIAIYDRCNTSCSSILDRYLLPPFREGGGRVWSGGGESGESFFILFLFFPQFRQATFRCLLVERGKVVARLFHHTHDTVEADAMITIRE